MAYPQLSSALGGRRYRPRSPQGDGSLTANGYEAIGQGGAPAPAAPGGASPVAHPMAQVQQAPSGGQGQTPAQGGAQTFAQMQSAGVARPAPQMVGAYTPKAAVGTANTQLQSAVSSALTTPSRYDSAQVQQVRDAGKAQLNTEFGAQRKQIEETLAKRGLLSSSYAGGYYGDLAGQQANALASAEATLVSDAAKNWAADRAGALSAGQDLSNSLSTQDLAGYTANAQGAAQNNAAINAEGQLMLGERAQGAQESQFTQSQMQQKQQFDANLELQRSDMTQKYGAMEADRRIQQMKVENDAKIAQAQLAEQTAQRLQQGAQFEKSFGLESTVGLGNLGLEGQKVANQAGQFTSAQLAQIQQFNAQLELQRADLTQKYGAAEADRLIEAKKVENQQNQFTQAQGQQAGQFTAAQQAQIAQFNAQLELQRSDLTQKYGAADADRIIEGKKVEYQNQQFGQAQTQQNRQFDAAQAQQDRQAQASLLEQVNQRLQQGQQFKQSQEQQAGQFTSAQEQQNEQFKNSLAEQVKARLQSGQQFDTSTMVQFAQILGQKDFIVNPELMAAIMRKLNPGATENPVPTPNYTRTTYTPGEGGGGGNNGRNEAFI